MVRLESNINNCEFGKIVLEETPEGTYIFVFETAQSNFPEQDHLQDDLATAQEICLEEYGVPLSSWSPARE